MERRGHTSGPLTLWTHLNCEVALGPWSRRQRHQQCEIKRVGDGTVYEIVLVCCYFFDDIMHFDPASANALASILLELNIGEYVDSIPQHR